MNLADSLFAIGIWLERVHRIDLVAALRPGISAETVTARLSAAGCRSASSLEELYLWHDGTELPSDGVVEGIEIIPGFYFLSVDDAIVVRSEYLQQAEWSASWLPILTDGAGSCYVAELDGSEDPAMRRWEFDATEEPMGFTSLTALARTIERAYARGVFFVDGRGYLGMDQGRFETLIGELNSGSEGRPPDGGAQ